MDPSGAPSQILGNVTAQGTVLVINRNGIIFGAGAQINVHSLVASSLDLLNANDDLVQTSTDIAASNQAFLNGGLAGLEAGTSSTTPVNNGNPTEILGLGNNVSVTSASQLQIPGDITIAPRRIDHDQCGRVGQQRRFRPDCRPECNQCGSITAAATGQVILAAGMGVSLIPNSSDPQVLQPELTGRISIPVGNGSTDITPAGTLLNTGVVQTERGDINLLGSSVTQNGVVGVTTDVSTPGNIIISTVDENIANPPNPPPGSQVDVYPGQFSVSSTVIGGGIATNRAGALVFGDGSVTTVLADTDGLTATSAPGQTTFTPGQRHADGGLGLVPVRLARRSAGIDRVGGRLDAVGCRRCDPAGRHRRTGADLPRCGCHDRCGGAGQCRTPHVGHPARRRNHQRERSGRLAASARQLPQRPDRRGGGFDTVGHKGRWSCNGWAARS